MKQFFCQRPKSSNSWNDIYYDQTNNSINFKYEDLNKLIFKKVKKLQSTK